MWTMLSREVFEKKFFNRINAICFQKPLLLLWFESVAFERKMQRSEWHENFILLTFFFVRINNLKTNLNLNQLFASFMSIIS